MAKGKFKLKLLEKKKEKKKNAPKSMLVDCSDGLLHHNSEDEFQPESARLFPLVFLGGFSCFSCVSRCRKNHRTILIYSHFGYAISFSLLAGMDTSEAPKLAINRIPINQRFSIATFLRNEKSSFFYR